MHNDQRNLVLLFWLVAGVLAITSANALGADYTVHVVEPAVTNHMILPDGPLPAVCKQKSEIKLSGCRGEYEPASFVVTTSKSLEGVRIEGKPLRGDSGKVRVYAQWHGRPLRTNRR